VVTAGVLISGGGTNLQAILDGEADGSLDCRIPLVVSNRPAAAGLERARRLASRARVLGTAGILTRGLRRGAGGGLARSRVELVVLAGFDRIVARVLLGLFRRE
jgi:phosphoribosylglycinamide formyltransferase-1